MTAISWKNQVSGNWTTPADWSTGTVPTLNDDVTIQDFGADGYIISFTSADVAKTLTFDATGVHVGGAELLENLGSLTLSGALSVEGGLVVLNRANNIGGGVGLSNFNAVLSVGNAGALGTGQLTASGGELLGTINETLTNYIESDGAFSIAAAHGTTLDIGSAGWLLGNDGVLPNFGGPGQDGTVVLHVPSIASSGGTGSAQSKIQSGTLKAGDANIGGLLGDPILDSGATLDLAGFSESLGRIHGYGTVINSGAAATLTVFGGSDFDVGGGSFAGSITGAIALTIAGPVTLSGANTYTGTTAINSVTGDSLTLGNGGATGSIGGGSIDDEGTFIIDRNNALILTNAIFGGGLLDQEGTGTTSINTTNSYSGGTTISAGTLAVGNAGALGTSPLTITGGELLGTANETLANSLNLQGSFTIAAAHDTTLTIGSGGLQLTQATGDTLFFGAPGQDGTVVCDFSSSSIPESNGVTEVRSGTLEGGDAIGDRPEFGRQMIVDAGATFDIAGIGQGGHSPVNDLTGAGTVTDSGLAETLYIRGTTFAGTFSGALSLDVQTTSLFSGLSDYSGETFVEQLATLTNTGVFDLVSNAGVTASQSDPTATFVNDGLFEKTGGGVSTVSAAFTNNGTIDVTDGSVSFTGGFTNNGTIHGLVSTSGGMTTISAAAPGDFNGSSTSDVLWINPSNDTIGDWLMNNGTPTWQVVGQGSSSVNIEGFGDFTGNGTSDLGTASTTFNPVKA